MTDVSDMELVRAYLQQDSEEAFATLVRRHINLVYSAALRHVGIAAQAEEITQAVFIILARKAGSLRPDTVLESWLYETTRLTSSSFLRGERRRQWREQEAYMQSTPDESNGVPVWNQMSPLLDEAMARLGKKDRDAVILRFFKKKNLGEVAAALQVTEAAAQRRVHRALEKLHQYFNKRGLSSTTAVIAGELSANSIHAAPVALAKTVTAVAVAKGAAASTSTLTLIKGALKLMAWTKAKAAVVIGAGILLAAGTATVIVERAVPAAPASTYETIFKHPSSQSVNLLESAPPALILRPTQFPKKEGSGFWTRTGKSVAVNFPLNTLFGIAYGFSPARVVFPDDVDLGNTNYDILITVLDHQNKALQAELKKQFGLAGHAETRETDVLLLKVADPAKLQLYRTKGGGYANYGTGSGNIQKRIYRNVGLAVVADYIEVKKPIFDRTGSKEHYDFNFQWTEQKQLTTDAGMSAFQNIWNEQLSQVGLELVPTNMPIEMLVVEKAP